MDLGTLVPIIVVLSICATCCWLVGANVYVRRLQLQARDTLHRRLFDRFAAPGELVEFLRSEAGGRFLDAMASDPTEPAYLVLRSVHKGVVLVTVGTGSLILGWSVQFQKTPLVVLGGLAFSLGIGYLLAAAIAHHMSRPGMSGRPEQGRAPSRRGGDQPPLQGHG